jgi:hypothetical protein
VSGAIGKTLGVAAVLTALTTQGALAQGWPRINGTDRPECRQAFDLAKTVFQSEAITTYVPAALPQSFGSRFSLHAPDDQQVTATMLDSDPRIFEKLDFAAGSPVRHVAFWQRTPQSGRRLVVTERTFGWQGDVYALLSLDANITRDVLLRELQAHPHDDDYPYPTLVAFSWDPPVILTDKATGKSWVIIQDTRFKLGAWSVLTTENDGTQRRCTIRFEPQVRKAVYLLPAPVQRYAALLDEALGPGNNEGTLQQTARMRAAINLFWGDAALRPWGLDGSAYNTRKQVDDGLRAWSKGDAKRKAVLAAIIDQKSKAEAALATYYANKFRMPDADAKRLADFILGVMYRSYFVFSGGREVPTEALPNPWAALSHARAH